MYIKQVGGEKLHHLLMAYLFSNICTKNYWYWATTVKIIVSGWVVYFSATQRVKLFVKSHKFSNRHVFSAPTRCQQWNMKNLWHQKTTFLGYCVALFA